MQEIPHKFILSISGSFFPSNNGKESDPVGARERELFNVSMCLTSDDLMNSQANACERGLQTER